MTMMTRILGGGAAIAALAAAAPAAAQYAYPYGYNPYQNAYGYAQPYGNAYGYNNNVSQMAVSRCSAAVQAQLNSRNRSGGFAGILGAIFGTNTRAYSSGRVLSITQVDPDRNRVQVRGLASSGANYGYGPYGAGAYGAYGYGYAQPDLRFECDVDYRGRIRDIDINRRR